MKVKQKEILAGLLCLFFFPSSVMAEIFYAPLLHAQGVEMDSHSSGIRLGGFVLQPAITLGTVYDSNVFRTSDDESADVLMQVNPSLFFKSNWSRHEVLLMAESDIGRYRQYTGKNFEDYGLALAGRYDLTHGTWLGASVVRKKLHQDQINLVDNEDGSANQYTLNSFQAGFTRALSFIKLKLFGEHEEVDYGVDSTLIEEDQNIRRETNRFQTTVSYEPIPLTGLFVTLGGEDSQYWQEAGAEQTLNGWDLRYGLNFNGGGIWSGSLYRGLIYRSFDSGETNARFNYWGGNLIWNPTRLTSLALTYDQKFNTTNVTGAAGSVLNLRRIKLSHNFSEKFSSFASLGMNDTEYFGGDNSTSRLFDQAIGAEYMLSDKTSLRMGYDHRRRSSTDITSGYDDQRINFSITFKQ